MPKKIKNSPKEKDPQLAAFFKGCGDAKGESPEEKEQPAEQSEDEEIAPRKLRKNKRQKIIEESDEGEEKPGSDFEGEELFPDVPAPKKKRGRTPKSTSLQAKAKSPKNQVPAKSPARKKTTPSADGEAVEDDETEKEYYPDAEEGEDPDDLDVNQEGDELEDDFARVKRDPGEQEEAELDETVFIDNLPKEEN